MLPDSSVTMKYDRKRLGAAVIEKDHCASVQAWRISLSPKARSVIVQVDQLG